ncbi:Mut7-C ubiquitin/RNAse domain-containing protein [Actinoallomurus rhizosphaericola]|uniref:Mut7-C ubiquitin/RNAse domain-containing protein n=1 Tax=Actinoallomurus rhizosphaericola TaxID=2952536 RepID=UPI002093E08F|nr:Mut7-C ubiquitin/RNAse domain-containing protein [Actinoallomurus rhizosphaericola]MCO5996058.1 Mut7-C ubiquitin/RNAse domain-containing protein [Actinoallomurus rhizosphaericola]
MGHARLEFAAELRFFLAPAARGGALLAPLDGTSSLGHLVESVGVPLPEVGALLVAGRPVAASYRPQDGDVVRVDAVRRPQRLPAGPPRFTLDVHLGKLARRLRLVGVDTDYHNDIDDDVLVELANREERVVLTQDRGLLRRRRLWFGAYVRGTRPEEQFLDVLDRFAPPLAPWTRCTACNGVLTPVAKETIEHLLQPGTRRNYDGYARCEACGRLYWKGAHHRRLQAIVDAALSSS